MTITLCLPSLNRYDLLARAIATARAGSLPPDRVLVVDNGGALQPLPEVEIHKPGRNLGVAASWNWFFRNVEQDWVIVSNDDVVFHHDTIAKLVEKAEQTPDQYFFCPRGGAGRAFSMFLLKKAGWETIGPFDECLWPAWFEDNDYAYRLKLAGQKENHADCSYDHDISATLAVMSAEQKAFMQGRYNANHEYYIRKHGGDRDGGETFTIPFNGQ